MEKISNRRTKTIIYLIVLVVLFAFASHLEYRQMQIENRCVTNKRTDDVR